MAYLLIKNPTIINENNLFKAHVLVHDGKFKDIYFGEVPPYIEKKSEIIDAEGLHLLPGIIDSHVHFREPGLTQKAEIETETQAAIAGGVTSFFDMPNTIPQTTTQKELENKLKIAENKSLCNFGFFLGATNNNIKEIQTIDKHLTCGIKLFMGASTGNMAVNSDIALERLFENSELPIAAHCEDDAIINKNIEKYKKQFNNNIPFDYHPIIRSAEACLLSSKKAVDLAKKYNSRLHLLHLSTAQETELLSNNVPLYKKRITGEACIHHLWFTDKDYADKGNKIKCNPAIKSEQDKQTLQSAVNSNLIDTIATDHAPHTLTEKTNNYLTCPSGSPMVQHALNIMLELYHKNIFSLETIVQKLCHAPAIIFQISRRGFIKRDYWADFVLVDLKKYFTINKKNILYKCKWSSLEDETIHSLVTHTFVNGNLIYQNGNFVNDKKGKKIDFER